MKTETKKCFNSDHRCSECNKTNFENNVLIFEYFDKRDYCENCISDLLIHDFIEGKLKGVKKKWQK